MSPSPPPPSPLPPPLHLLPSPLSLPPVFLRPPLSSCVPPAPFSFLGCSDFCRLLFTEGTIQLFLQRAREQIFQALRAARSFLQGVNSALVTRKGIGNRELGVHGCVPVRVCESRKWNRLGPWAIICGLQVSGNLGIFVSLSIDSCITPPSKTEDSVVGISVFGEPGR